ncbi:MAG TPA: hypothetical protein VFC78_01950 [Tepidisphaeraceae bacterium]|nr:hypothetical protein [Tepidisphaeraceae bacterium]
MSELISTATKMLAERKVSADRRRQAAERAYARLLAAQVSAPEDARALVAAMDELQLGSDELIHDSRQVSAGRAFEGQLAEIEMSLKEANTRVAIAAGTLHEVQGGGHRATIERAHVGVGEAEAVIFDLESHARALRQQIEANAASAPRVFAGHSRLLAVPKTPPHSDSPDEKLHARMDKTSA